MRPRCAVGTERLVEGVSVGLALGPGMHCLEERGHTGVRF